MKENAGSETLPAFSRITKSAWVAKAERKMSEGKKFSHFLGGGKEKRNDLICLFLTFYREEK